MIAFFKYLDNFHYKREQLFSCAPDDRIWGSRFNLQQIRFQLNLRENVLIVGTEEHLEKAAQERCGISFIDGFQKEAR